MSLSIIHTRAQVGIHAPLVTVETHLSNGLPSLAIVGLPETAVRESKERVRSALINSGFEFPTRRITINLAPADLPKQGGRYDLAIALSILVASGQLDEASVQDFEFLGELALTGEIRAVSGVLPSAIAAYEADKSVLLAHDNLEDASISSKGQAFGAKHLLDVCMHLKKEKLLISGQAIALNSEQAINAPLVKPDTLDLADVKGQFMARQALEIAAAGRHNLLFYGPPGTGKSMLASRLPSILPSLKEDERLEVASIYSLTSQLSQPRTNHQPPFRSPHHTSSSAALVGGGSVPKPGEISLAHNGVLFLDELPEFGRKVLEVLREPIESGEIHLSRANSRISFPAKFQLLAAMNPCPCGYSGHPRIPCSDTPQQIEQYRKKLSGPLLDRFDLHVEVTYQASSVLLENTQKPESSADVYARVKSARDIQRQRQGKLNSELLPKELEDHCLLSQDLRNQLEQAMDRLAISARGAHRVLRVARTLADLQATTEINETHLFQALSYRGLDRKAP